MRLEDNDNGCEFTGTKDARSAYPRHTKVAWTADDDEDIISELDRFDLDPDRTIPATAIRFLREKLRDLRRTTKD